MLLLSLIWLVIGLLLGALACGAKLRPASWGKRGWLLMLCIGMLSALSGGWLGAWLFGSQYATLTALWVGVLGVCIIPRVFIRRKARTVVQHP
ncbi:MAG TPA: hypothetical protein VJO32_01015 [Ktedonobacteraceae bacterium]|nr:hypothetical protein [Ktedonobacteraceae bacterium]